MNLVDLQAKLLAAARAHPPSEQVPYAFEKRILARLRSAPALEPAVLWAQGLWRAVGPCVAIMLLLGAWSLLSPANPPAPDFAQQLDNTVLAAADQDPGAGADSLW